MKRGGGYASIDAAVDAANALARAFPEDAAARDRLASLSAKRRALDLTLMKLKNLATAGTFEEFLNEYPSIENQNLPELVETRQKAIEAAAKAVHARAQELLARNDVDGAIREFQAALRRDPRNRLLQTGLDRAKVAKADASRAQQQPTVPTAVDAAQLDRLRNDGAPQASWSFLYMVDLRTGALLRVRGFAGLGSREGDETYANWLLDEARRECAAGAACPKREEATRILSEPPRPTAGR